MHSNTYNLLSKNKSHLYVHFRTPRSTLHLTRSYLLQLQQSVFYGSAWTFHPRRGQFYLHQFTKEQPDLNFRNPAVTEQMDEVMRFWLRKGVAGFRIDAVNHLFEAEDFPDEPLTGTDADPLSYGYTHHYYTKDLVS